MAKEFWMNDREWAARLSGGVWPAHDDPQSVQSVVDTAYDSGKFRDFPAARGSTAVIKPNPTRKNVPPFDAAAYKGRNVIERAVSHLKDWRRVATRYDQPARNYRSPTMLAILFRWWI